MIVIETAVNNVILERKILGVNLYFTPLVINRYVKDENIGNTINKNACLKIFRRFRSHLLQDQINILLFQTSNTKLTSPKLNRACVTRQLI